MAIKTDMNIYLDDIGNLGKIIIENIYLYFSR